MSTRTTTTRLAAALGVATAITLGFTAAPAQAAPLGVLAVNGLSIERVGGGNCRVVTTGTVQMESQAAAQYLADRATFSVRIQGDDPVDDDYLSASGPVQEFITPYAQVYFYSEATFRCRVLNEDDDFYDGKDEIYSRVNLFGITGNQTRNSPVWHDYF